MDNKLYCIDETILNPCLSICTFVNKEFFREKEGMT